MENKWTPGPWRVMKHNIGEGQFAHYISTPRGALAYAPYPEKHGDNFFRFTEADAALVSAAPELYKALEWMLADGTPDHKCGGHGGSSCTCNCARDKALAALAKARGES